jgi:gamma-glutamylcyclotransferase
MERVPSAELIGVATHPNHRLTFHKKSNDGSSKCNMFDSGSESDLIYGAIYRLEQEQKDELDRFEGKGYGYIDNLISLNHDGVEYTCFTYLAQQSHIVDNLKPYHWYKRLVVLGAQYLGFPAPYVAFIEAVKSMEDPNPERRKENELLIESIINYR